MFSFSLLLSRPHPLRPRCQDLVLDIFEEYAGRTGSLDYANYVKAVAEHPVVVQFACGEGTERYGSAT